jgi:hypothetical protein
MTEATPTLDDYRDRLLRASREHSERRVRTLDPDGYEGAKRAILATAWRGEIFSADDVVWAVRGNELGPAFRELARSGDIVAVGFTVSRRPKGRGHVIRTWRRAP